MSLSFSSDILCVSNLMEFDPSIVGNFSHLSGYFSETPCQKYEIPAMVLVQPSSTPSPPLSHDNAFLYINNYQNFQQHPLNGDKHYSIFAMGGPSSIGPFCLVLTPSLANSLKATHTSGSMTDFPRSCHPMAFSPNNNEIEVMHGYLNSRKNYLDFVNKNPLQFNAISQSQVGLSLSPLLVNDVVAYVAVKPKLRDELSYTVGTGNNLPDTDLRLGVGDQKKQRRFETKNNESNYIDTIRIKGQWTMDEDRVLTYLVNWYGPKKWSQIAKFIDGRIGKQCRERWNNHLRPNIRKDSWSEEEEKILIEAHKQVGKKWGEIARILPGRTENNIKNHWNNIKRRVNGNRRNDGVKRTLLENYIKEVTNAKGGEIEMKQTTRMINTGSKQDHNNKNGCGLTCVHYDI